MEFVRLNRTKVFRDPLYGYIEVDYKLISDKTSTPSTFLNTKLAI